MFAAVTAEEQGLLGSRYFAARPTVPRASIVANVNVDMFLPLYPMRSVIGLGADESDLGDDLRARGRGGRRGGDRGSGAGPAQLHPQRPVQLHPVRHPGAGAEARVRAGHARVRDW